MVLLVVLVLVMTMLVAMEMMLLVMLWWLRSFCCYTGADVAVLGFFGLGGCAVMRLCIYDNTLVRWK